MHGRHGLALVVFGVLLAVLRAFDVPPFRSVRVEFVEIAYLISLFGLAVSLVGVLSRAWRTCNERLGVFEP